MPRPAPHSPRDNAYMTCAKCGKEIAAGEQLCSNCGAPTAPPRGPWFWIAALILLAVFAGALAYRVYLLQRPAQPAQKVELSIPAAQAPSAAPTPSSEAPAPPRQPAKRESAPAVSSRARQVAPPRAPVPVFRIEGPAPTPAVTAETPPPKTSQPARPRAEIFRPDPTETAPASRAPSRAASEAQTAPAPQPAYEGPSAGTLIWSGQIEKDTLVTINGDRVSLGRLTGELPGVPVRIELETDAFAIVEKPSPANNWKRLSLRSLKRLRSAQVIKWSLPDAGR